MDYEAFLKERKIKVTQGRVIILEIIDNYSQAISADNIYEQCKEKGHNVDLSTVYRSLDLFERKDIIEKFNLGDGKYNYKIKDHKHKHVIECSLCHKEVEIDCPMLPVEELIKNKTGFVLIEHELKVKAVCQECMKHSKENKKK
ncbi:Fur family transcriptional regulator [Clostridium pasteurianum]|uniref:Fe2+/Zn2+ uptake regulation protein n=1 Tax=Clostridium pasteurianum BC1 TaxID=86416 RepID=R4K699_CLOPA|nr:Fur family transcriptional regulator [Clostridium pasteurianum]AGK98722.1 Fe2+/Zn2+ uptake regulation protein [Clostridium pasteurianum BC1]